MSIERREKMKEKGNENEYVCNFSFICCEQDN